MTDIRIEAPIIQAKHEGSHPPPPPTPPTPTGVSDPAPVSSRVLSVFSECLLQPWQDVIATLHQSCDLWERDELPDCGQLVDFGPSSSKLRLLMTITTLAQLQSLVRLHSLLAVATFNGFAHIPCEDTPNFPKPPQRKQLLHKLLSSRGMWVRS